MTREQFEALMNGDGDPSLALMGGLGKLGRAHRAALDMAADLLEEGLPDVRYTVPEEEPLRLAASDPGAPFPARYRGGGYTVALWRGAGAAPQAMLEEGPTAAALVLGGQSVRLNVGQQEPVPWIDAPPEVVALIPEGGLPLALHRDPAR